MGSPYPNNPYQFSRNGQLFIIPVGPTIPEVPYPTQTFTKPPDYSLWVRGKIEEPAFQLDAARMPPSMYQEVRDDLVRYSPVPVSRSAFHRSQHAYVGVIDSKGTPYYFALDSRGISVRPAGDGDDRVWKTFDRLADMERSQAMRERRADATKEVEQVGRELSEPMLVVTKGLRYGKTPSWHHDAPGSSWWRHAPREKPAKQPKEPKAPKPPKPSAGERAAARTKVHLENYEARARGRQEIRDKLRAERKKTKVAKPKADDSKLDTWKQKHPGGNVETMHAHPFARALDGKLHLVVLKADKVTFPKDHEAAMRVPKGGSCCKNCSFVDVDGHACKSEHYVKWAGTHKLPPLPLDEICSDWYEPRAPIEKAISSEHFAHVVQRTTNAAPEEHGFGPRKVFIHHVHEAAKQHLGGMSLKEFKDRLPEHRRAGTLHMARADLVGAMDPKKVAASETKDGPAEHHFLLRTVKAFVKALPRKPKEEKVKKRPTRKATKKQAGAGGKTRYTYPQEKRVKNKKKNPNANPARAQHAEPVEHDDAIHSDPVELANQLKVSLHTLQTAARRKGCKGFARFMRSHLKRFSAKHGLGSDYWATIYSKLVGALAPQS